MATTAERIKQLRKKKGISQSELAEVIGVKNNTVSTWERGIQFFEFHHSFSSYSTSGRVMAIGTPFTCTPAPAGMRMYGAPSM